MKRVARKLELLLVLVCCFALMSCANRPLSDENRLVKVTIDKTFGQYDKLAEENLILVTLKPQDHNKLTRISEPLPSKHTLPPEYLSFIEYIGIRYELERLADWPLKAIDIFCIVFESKGSRDLSQLIAQLEREPAIETAQPVNTFSVQQSRGNSYNDPYMPLQHGLKSLGAALSHRWSRGRGVRIAVIDTGLDTEHPDLKRSLLLRRNFVDRDDNQFTADVHGTAVAGVIAAVADNDTGMVGVAPLSNLMALKACWQVKRSGEKATCNSLTLAKALNYAIVENADIINLSLSGPPDELLERLVAEALNQNIIVIGAKPPHDKPSFPTITPGTISVAMPASPFVDAGKSLVAPGQKVLSTRPGSEYDFFTGSSFSTAHIAGLAALVRELSPELSPAELLALLNKTADPETGGVNACAAIVELAQPASHDC